MVEPKYCGAWESPLKLVSKDKGIKVADVFKQVDDNTPEHWFTLAENYKFKIKVSTYDHFMKETGGGYDTKYTHVFHKERLSRYVHGDLYKIVKPLKAVEVPLGQLCKDRYKSWFA